MAEAVSTNRRLARAVRAGMRQPPDDRSRKPDMIGLGAGEDKPRRGGAAQRLAAARD
jgi:hypothetical protein